MLNDHVTWSWILASDWSRERRVYLMLNDQGGQVCVIMMV